MGLERVYESSITLRDLRREPLGILMDGFCDWLLGCGFAWQTTRKHLGRILHLNKWLCECGWRWPGELSREEIEGFLRVYPMRCANRSQLEPHLKRMGWSISRFIEFLVQRNLFNSQAAAPVYQPLLDGYIEWMRDHQHAREGTLRLRYRSITRFLESLGSRGTRDGLGHLCAEYIESFFLDYSQEKGPAERRSMQTGLRTFLRFCQYEGLISHRLDHAVPTLRTYRLSRVPRGLTEPQAHTLLESVARNSDVGRRDYAMLRLLYTYGVRGGQVRNLQFADIHWSKDEILFKAMKDGKASLMPLTAAVGEALLDYLQNGRPESASPEIFLTCRAPYRRMKNSSTLSHIVATRIRAAGLDVPCKGSHAFRHAFATRMVAEGHPLKAVADILGHRHLSTTFIYTKVDFNALSQVALEWPEEVAS